MARMIIAGEECDALSGATYEVRNPANGEVVDIVPKGSAEDVRRAVDAAEAAFRGWSETPAHQRAEIMHRAADIVRQNLDDIARTLTREQGKTLLESKIETERFAANLDYYADLADKIRGEYVTLPDKDKYGMVVRRPIGVVGAIVPWNFPLTLMANKLAPALAAGNTIVVKPSSTTPLASIKCIQALVQAGIPAGVANIVTGPGGVVGEELLSNPKVRKISFTGQTETGKHVMEVAAQNIKHVTLELGGSDPMIVCDDADLDAAAQAARVGRFFNCGQACLAVKRLYLFDSIADQFIEKLLAQVKRLKVGDGLDKDTRMGPLHTAQQRAEVEEMVQDAVNRGAKVIYGGKRPEGPEYERGNYYLPTLLVDVPDDALMVREECFGPALPIFRVSGLEEAIEKANSSKYGLGSSIWTRDVRKSKIAIERLEAGYTWVNSLQIAHDELPFGGTKLSGFGKEHGLEALDYYTEAKSVVVGAV